MWDITEEASWDSLKFKRETCNNYRTENKAIKI